MKKITTYSIDETVLLKFNELSEKLGINKSKLINILISKWIDEHE
jgi:antitoxin component of RelBE/YafQ-DinJ toxin-antitoxin module